MTPEGRGPCVALIDYEMSNLRSAGKALERLGARVQVAARPGDARGADAIVLPGVGRFGAAMERLRALGFADMIRGAVSGGTPLLGICLGLQLLFDASEESPGVAGLGLVPGGVRRLGTDLKVPHIGWAEVDWAPGCALAPAGIAPSGRTYYFVHSYSCLPDDPAHVMGTARHGTPFVAAAGHDRVAGVQFHPEKSSAAGLALIGRWLDGVAATAGAPA